MFEVLKIGYCVWFSGIEVAITSYLRIYTYVMNGVSTGICCLLKKIWRYDLYFCNVTIWITSPQTVNFSLLALRSHNTHTQHKKHISSCHNFVDNGRLLLSLAPSFCLSHYVFSYSWKLLLLMPIIISNGKYWKIAVHRLKIGVF